MFTMLPWSWLLIIIVVISKLTLSAGEIRVVCYYTNWSVYRPGTAKFNPQNINPYLCTHLIYAFGGFTKENTFKPFDKYQDIEKGGYAKFTGLKTYNKNLKTMLAVGGWNEGSSRFSPMVANPERRREFVKNSIKFLRQNHFDGLDLDWEYPSFRDGGKPKDKANYASLVQELREEYERESEKTGRPRLLLTMAVPAGIEYINKGYDVPRLMKYLDWMNILSYDYHSAFEPAVNHHSPLYSMEEESEYNYDSDLNINHTINHYLEAGAHRDKLVLGIPTYGRSYTLFNPDATEIGDPADGPGEMGDATRENGYLAYYEICEKLKDDDWIVEQPNPNAMGPYAYKDDQWVGYDDESIVRKKSEFVAQKKLGGIMFWSIDNDDFRGNCNGKPYPLIEAAKEALMAASGYTIDNIIPPSDKPSKTKTRTRTRPTSKKNDEEEETKPAQNSGGRQHANVTPTRKRVRTKTRNEEAVVVPTTRKRRIRVHKKEENVEPVEETTKKRRLKIVKQETKRRYPVTSTTPNPSLSKYQTPEPPTTPDPGGDFKCEDEGFYPHPRDCKKYFWCLSSGPSDLGIVAHQFNCPSGLYFNKAADSCDYTQNVLCNKKKTKATSTTASTTTTTTTTTSTPAPISSTRRVPSKITAATSKTTFAASTTTPNYEDEYEYVDDDEELGDGDDDEEEDVELDSEEDPRVLKELIYLIKKAGGIEELEKQLNIHEGEGTSATASGSTTPSGFSKTLYERVLSQAAAKNAQRPQTKTTNSRGPQFDGSKDVEVSSSFKRTRPQYTAITRQRPTTEKLEDDEKVIEEVEDEVVSRKSTQPEYITISRSRPTTVSTLDLDKSARTTVDDADTEKTIVTIQTPEYVTLKRRRPTTEGTTSTKRDKVYVTDATVRIDEVEKETDKPALSHEDEQNITNVNEISQSFLNEGQNSLAINNTENLLTNNESSQGFGPSTIEITTESSTTATTKVSEPITTKNTLRARPFQNATSDSRVNNSTNVFERGQNNFRKRFQNNQPEKQAVHNRKRITIGPQYRPRQFSTKTNDDDISNETDNTPVSAGSLTGVTDAPLKNDNESTKSSKRRPTTRRGSAKFEYPESRESGEYYYEDYDGHQRIVQDRKYRPDIAAGISDLSSLTSADFSKSQLNTGSRRRVVPRQRIVTTTSTTTVRPLKEDNLKTSLRTLPLTRKLIPGQEIDKTKKRPVETTTIQAPRINKFVRPTGGGFKKNANASTPTTKRPIAEDSSTVSGKGRLNIASAPEGLLKGKESAPEGLVNRRKVIRRFRPTTTASTTITIATTSTTPTTTVTTPATSTTTTTPATTTLLEENEIIPESTIHVNSQELPIVTTEIQKNKTERNIYNDIQDKSNSDEDDIYKTPEEEEENIKLSETNIREKSEIRINALNDNNEKLRRRVVKKLIGEGKSVQTKTNYFEENEDQFIYTPSTEPAPIVIRTRKVIRKLPPTTPLPPETTTKAFKARTRKIIRKIKPTLSSKTIDNLEDVGFKTYLGDIFKKRLNTDADETNGQQRIRKIKVIGVKKNDSAINQDSSVFQRWQKFRVNQDHKNASENLDEARAVVTTTSTQQTEIETETEAEIEESTTVAVNEETTTEEMTTEGELTTTETVPETTVTSTTAKSTTPFYYRVKLSRPPFLLQRTRPATEASIAPTKEITKVPAHLRYTTKPRNKYKSLYEKKISSTTTTSTTTTTTATTVESVPETTTFESEATTTDRLDETTTEMEQTVATTTIVDDFDPDFPELSRTTAAHSDEDIFGLLTNYARDTNVLSSLFKNILRPSVQSTTSLPDFDGDFDDVEFDRLFNETTTADLVTSTAAAATTTTPTLPPPTTLPPPPTTITTLPPPPPTTTTLPPPTTTTTATPTTFPTTLDDVTTQKSTERVPLHLHTTKRVTLSYRELDTTTSEIPRIYLKPTTESNEDYIQDRSNKPQFVPKRFQNRPTTERPALNVSKRFGGSRTISSQKRVNNPNVYQNVEIKNTRNKLFNKPRKVNTPHPGILATSPSSTEPTTTPETSTVMTTSEIPDQTATFLHVFAEPENATVTLTTITTTTTTTEPYSEAPVTSHDKKMERLIEVNRIVEVSLKEGKLSHNAMALQPTVDRIGAINRVTVIKVVDSLDDTFETIDNGIYNDGQTTESAEVKSATITNNYRKLEDENYSTKPNVIDASTPANNESAEVKSIEITNNGQKLEDANYSTKSNVVIDAAAPANNETTEVISIEITNNGQELKDENYSTKPNVVIDASSPANNETYEVKLIEIYSNGKKLEADSTPFYAETSTISLEGLFRPKTQNANFVNVKILEQDDHSRNFRFDQEQPIVPIRLLKQDEYTTLRAEVREIAPETNAGYIKIAPIAISLGNMQTVAQPRQSSDVGVVVAFPTFASKGDE